MAVFGVVAFRYFLESRDCFSFEQFELIQYFCVSNFVEFFFFVFHSVFDENSHRLLRGCKKEEQQRGERVQKEVPQIAFAVFVTHIPDKIKICVVMSALYLFQCLHYDVVTLVVAMREQKENQHVRHSLLYQGCPGVEHVCAHQVR